jgi:hypothetical protein
MKPEIKWHAMFHAMGRIDGIDKEIQKLTEQNNNLIAEKQLLLKNIPCLEILDLAQKFRLYKSDFLNRGVDEVRFFVIEKVDPCFTGDMVMVVQLDQDKENLGSIGHYWPLWKGTKVIPIGE